MSELSSPENLQDGGIFAAEVRALDPATRRADLVPADLLQDLLGSDAARAVLAACEDVKWNMMVHSW